MSIWFVEEILVDLYVRGYISNYKNHSTIYPIHIYK
jgi:hypothetical protein